MKDELISIETAILAKEKGFNIPVKDYTQRSAVIGNDTILPLMVGKRYNWNEYGVDVPYFSIPSQSLLQRWLRETHGIDVSVIWFDRGYLHAVEKRDHKGNHYRVEYKETYEEALEIALFEGLQKIV